MKTTLLVAFLSLFIHAECSAESAEIPLWPAGKLPKLDQPEKLTERSKDPAISNRSANFVSEPTIKILRPAHADGPTAAVIICPGGGYNGLAIDKEGYAVAAWLNKLGITGVVLKYRVPKRPDDPKHVLPLQDAQRALGYVRFHAKDLNVDPARIGIMGFSAGGHLTVNLSNNYETRAYEAVDEADKVSCRPDFSIPIYPAYLAEGDKLSPDIKVTPATPPTFLVQTEDDGVHVENCLFYYLALKNNKVPAENAPLRDGWARLWPGREGWGGGDMAATL